MEKENEGEARPIDKGSNIDMSRKHGSKKYAALKAKSNEQTSDEQLNQKRDTSMRNDSENLPSSGVASRWESMKSGFNILRSNIGSRSFLPLNNDAQGTTLNSQSSESLDEIFERLKNPPSEYRNHGDFDDHGMDFRDMASS